jgi:N-ethylmaleimide reductase
MSSGTLKLMTPVRLGPYNLRNRVVMAPLTRMRSGPGNVPSALNAEYYAQRASAGLIISEASPVSAYGHGYYNTPAIHTKEQADGWKQVVRAVHDQGTKMFLQLWHVGRMSHPDLQPGGVLPVGPSALASNDQAFTKEGPKPHPVPRPLRTEEIRGIVQEFSLGARLALDAGFDGVEIHGANGYLLEQFLASGSNRREDEYGGSAENRARLILEVTEVVAQVWGPERVGIRLSPANRHGNIEDADRWGTWSYLVRQLAPLRLAYLHLVEPRVDDSQDIENPDLRLASVRFRGLLDAQTQLISAGGHNLASAEAAVRSGSADLVAFGRLFVSNPDLPRRFEAGAPLNAYDRSSFYGGDERGYTDYPFLESASRFATAD